MKRLFIFGLTFFCAVQMNGQSTTATNVGNPSYYLGYSTNNNLLFRTANVNRMKLNESVSYTINGSNDARAGYLLIGRDMPLWAGGPNELYSNVGAFSLLHLIGDDSPFVQEGGKIC